MTIAPSAPPADDTRVLRAALARLEAKRRRVLEIAERGMLGDVAPAALAAIVAELRGT